VNDGPTPRWQKIVASGLAVATATTVGFGWSRIGPDLWPPDRSFVGPNLVAAAVQWAVLFVIAVLVWPPTRRRIHRFADRKLGEIHTRLDAHEALHAEHAAKLDRILEHLGDHHDD